DRRLAYLVMELLAGETLADRLHGGPLDEHEARHVCLQLCSALAACHASGIVHRYLTPANVHLCPRGGDPCFVKLTDSGIAPPAPPGRWASISTTPPPIRWRRRRAAPSTRRPRSTRPPARRRRSRWRARRRSRRRPRGCRSS